MRTRTESAVYFYEDGDIKTGARQCSEFPPMLVIENIVVVHPMTWEASLILEQGLREYCDALQKAREGREEKVS